MCRVFGIDKDLVSGEREDHLRLPDLRLDGFASLQTLRYLLITSGQSVILVKGSQSVVIRLWSSRIAEKRIEKYSIYAPVILRENCGVVVGDKVR